MDLREPMPPNGPGILPLVPLHTELWLVDGSSPENKDHYNDLRRAYRSCNPRSINDSREIGSFWKVLTIMCCRNEGHSKAILIVRLAATPSYKGNPRREARFD